MKFLQPEISLDYIHSLFKYNRESGELVWSVLKGRRGRPGERAGTLDRYGYLRVCIDHKIYAVHRIIWFYVYGEWPLHEIDHANGDVVDNRLCNLRLAQRWQNRANQKIRSDNTSGLKGVKKQQGCNRWSARIRKHGKEYRKFGFKTPEAAHLAYLEMARELFGEYARAA